MLNLLYIAWTFTQHLLKMTTRVNRYIGIYFATESKKHYVRYAWKKYIYNSCCKMSHQWIYLRRKKDTSIATNCYLELHAEVANYISDCINIRWVKFNFTETSRSIFLAFMWNCRTKKGNLMINKCWFCSLGGTNFPEFETIYIVQLSKGIISPFLVI